MILEKSIKIIGVINKRNIDNVSEIQIKVNGFSARYNISKLPLLLPIPYIIPYSGNNSFNSLKLYIKYCIVNLKNLSINNFLKITIYIPHDKFENELSKGFIEIDSNKGKPSISQNLAVHGIKPLYLDFNIAYDIEKNWKNKAIIFSKIKHLKSAGNIFNSRIESFFEIKSMPTKIESDLHLSTIILQDATVMHGQVITDQNNLYRYDSLQTPVTSESKFKIQHVMSQTDNNVLIPRPDKYLGQLEKAFFLGGTNNWMHFVLEDVPRLVRMRANPEIGDCVVIANSNLSQQIKSAIGKIVPNKIIYMSVFEFIKVQNLTFMYLNNYLPKIMRGQKDFFNNFVFDEVVEAFRPYKLNKLNIVNSHNRVLIAREQNLFRPMANFSKIRALLESSYGFKTFFLANMELDEIIKIFSEASIIVGEYGAGLANLVFSPEGSRVIEIRSPKSKYAREYELLTKKNKIEHDSIIGASKFFGFPYLKKDKYRLSARELRKILNNHV